MKNSVGTTRMGTEPTMAVETQQAVVKAQVVNTIAPAKMTLAEVRTKLEGKTGKRFWKNLDELSDSPQFQELMQEEFPRQAGAGEWVDSVSRRGFLKVMGASFALAGLAGCTKQPDEPIFPYVKQPEDLILGKPMYFATAHPFPTGAVPVLIKSDAFRPIKVEGNPEHPMSKGKSDAYTQATLLDLYDPDRSVQPKFRGEAASWGQFQQDFAKAVAGTKTGQGVYFLSETITSPTLASQWKQVSAKYPQAKLVQYDAVNNDRARASSKAAFGDYLDVQYKLEDADVILALDADFLGGIAFPGFLPLSAAYAERHRFEAGKTMNRMYVVETMPTVTGYKADHRLALKPSEIEAFSVALAGGNGSALTNPEAQKFLTAVLADLKKSGGKCVVMVGPQSPAAAHAAAHALNASLGAVGKTVLYTESIAPIPSEQGADLKSLVADMYDGKVQWLVMLGVNPLYNAPSDLEFTTAFNKVPNTVHLGSHVDETGFYSTWHVNKTHYLESWSDARAYDGTISIVQPMIDPLYGGKSAHDVLQALLDPSISAYDAVVANARTYITGDFAVGWKKALHDGWVQGTAFSPKLAGQPKAATPVALNTPAAGAIEISFRHDPSVYDGRYGNNGWLQELPKQVTNLSWDNAALMSMDLMSKLKIEENEAIELNLNGRKVIAPVLMAPGHPDDVVTVHLGFGRRAESGRVGAGVGFDAYSLRTSDAPLSASGLKVTGGKGVYDICVTKVHNIEHRGAYAQRDLEHPLSDKEGTYSLAGHEAMERSIIRYATVAEATANPKYASEGASGTWVNKVGYNPQGESPEHGDSFFPDAWHYNHTAVVGAGQKVLQNSWGMSVDLNSCIGCNACIVSCYAENNIPVVGREQVKIGRNMQWLRIDTYFEGDLHAPKAHFQPMMCQHCENAGCEQVCPVGATVHTPEGLNTMVYNRCVGTRYCSNNCMYKVRRFNFLLYADFDTESLKFMRNPDVSVRSRGVMEKCSYCIQRIEAVKIEADKNNRAIADGEIVTACQQACPTDAIIFGNINDPKSRIAKKKAEEREYQVLADLNFRPRTTYTAGVINPNPELA
ncbi:TAT-variant-translocated molybdopterin oxidoreductase [Granulicella mallensis]|uniref:Molybdopterin-containing oxidoreductase family iron-sulfur binding subunit n=1 Tax=Granulicella mallensis TaxID=940614 RepID=A0A7W8E8M2_9BACT|nr:TAT-variant-translocated molybdopterin oxidoreductase [Granulicella mallensis]MBB5063573.1 molybdopterin-containing oxidoreductase family iron-sulfur binding subunit [Granulicella mallensis]